MDRELSHAWDGCGRHRTCFAVSVVMESPSPWRGKGRTAKEPFMLMDGCGRKASWDVAEFRVIWPLQDKVSEDRRGSVTYLRLRARDGTRSRAC